MCQLCDKYNNTENAKRNAVSVLNKIYQQLVETLISQSEKIKFLPFV